MIVSLIKLVTYCIRRFSPYSATALPGLLLERYFPQTAADLFGQLEDVIVVTGTNGKTTTTKMLSHLLTENGMSHLTNHSGSNMIRGLLSTLVDRADWAGRIATPIAILEVEEATLPRLTKFVKPKTVVVTNIFRDQLDAYGEIDKTLEYLKTAISSLPNPELILNGDDERVSGLAKFTKGKVDFLGFALPYRELIKSENKGQEPKMSSKYEIANIRTDENLRHTFDIQINEKIVCQNFVNPIPGIFNCFSATAALLAFSTIINMPIEELSKKYYVNLSQIKPAFGRGEIIRFGNTNFLILLGKNPAGLNLNLNLVGSVVTDGDAILFILNDNVADGRDVSWIWDVDLSSLKSVRIYIAGTRALDMALRLKYAGFTVEQVFESVSQAVAKLVKENYQKVYVLPTYTAMLEFRKQLGKQTKVKKIHE